MRTRRVQSTRQIRNGQKETEGDARVVIDELNNIRSMIKEKQYLEERIAELEQQIYGLKPLATERTSKGGGAGDRLTTLIESRDKLQVKLAEKLEIINKAELRVEEEIDILTPEERNVIRYFYLKGYSWEKVAEVTSYAERSVRTHRDTAIKKLQENVSLPLIAFNCHHIL